MTKTATARQWLWLKFNVLCWIDRGVGSKIQLSFLNMHSLSTGLKIPKNYSFTPLELKFQAAFYVFQSHMRCIVQIVRGLFVMILEGILWVRYLICIQYVQVGKYQQRAWCDSFRCW